MAETKIEWTDVTWNPVTGCTKVGHRVELARVGKKEAGRELDGRTWDQFPGEGVA